jgi:4-carboxymuconolactone decarboxylase
MARLPPATRESVPENQREAFDEIVKAAGSVPRFGPGSLLLHLPHAHQRLMGFNRFLRSESSLPKKLQELAMLVAARELDCQYIWNSHAGSTREAGIANATVDALRERKELPKLPDDEAAVVRFGQEFFRTHRVSRGTFQLAMETLGRRGAIELGLFLGNYASLALLVNSFDADLPADRKEPLLPV